MTPRKATMTPNSTAISGNSRSADGRFLPGQSGNPGGRPAVVASVKELAKANGPRAFERLIELMESEDESISLAACKELLNRSYGKCAEPFVGIGVVTMCHEDWLRVLD